MRTRLATALLTVSVILLVAAPAALARYDGGQGIYGETTDKAVTNIMFGVILFFPAACLVLTLIHNRLDKRKAAKLAGRARESAHADGRGGW